MSVGGKKEKNENNLRENATKNTKSIWEKNLPEEYVERRCKEKYSMGALGSKILPTGHILSQLIQNGVQQQQNPN